MAPASKQTRLPNIKSNIKATPNTPNDLCRLTSSESNCDQNHKWSTIQLDLLGSLQRSELKLRFTNISLSFFFKFNVYYRINTSLQWMKPLFDSSIRKMLWHRRNGLYCFAILVYYELSIDFQFEIWISKITRLSSEELFLSLSYGFILFELIYS